MTKSNIRATCKKIKAVTKTVVKICSDELGWKRTTTYTVIKRLSERGVLKNDDGTVFSLVSKEEVQRAELDEVMEKKFENSLPAFIAAFAKSRKLSEKDIEEINRIINKTEKK